MSAVPAGKLDLLTLIAANSFAAHSWDDVLRHEPRNVTTDVQALAAATVELVEAARDYADATGPHTDERWAALRAFYGDAPIPVTRARLAAALARFGGAP